MKKTKKKTNQPKNPVPCLSPLHLLFVSDAAPPDINIPPALIKGLSGEQSQPLMVNFDYLSEDVQQEYQTELQQALASPDGSALFKFLSKMMRDAGLVKATRTKQASRSGKNKAAFHPIELYHDVYKANPDIEDSKVLSYLRYCARCHPLSFYEQTEKKILEVRKLTVYQLKKHIRMIESVDEEDGVDWLDNGKLRHFGSTGGVKQALKQALSQVRKEMGIKRKRGRKKQPS